MDSKDAIKKIQENPELAKSLEKALKNNADEKELAGMLEAAGFEAGTVDELLAEWQRRRGADISADDLDEETLRMVAGGDDGTSSDAETGECVKHFKEDMSTYYGEIGCDYWMWCDDNFCGINTDCAATTLNS